MAFVEIRRKTYPIGPSEYSLSLVLSITDAPEDMTEVSIGKGRLHHVELKKQEKIIFTEACPAGNTDDDWNIVQRAIEVLGISLEQEYPDLKKTFRFSVPDYD